MYFVHTHMKCIEVICMYYNNVHFSPGFWVFSCAAYFEVIDRGMGIVSFRPKAFDHLHLRMDKGAMTGKVRT